jgi:hypothetical protein
VYSSRSAYNLFFKGRWEVPGATELWSSGAPLKHKLHMWLALKDRLWTADRLQERGLRHPPHCTLCCQEDETVEHLTLQCSYSREVWFQLLSAIHLQHFTTSSDSVMALWWPVLSDAVPKSRQKELNSLVILAARALWLERNARGSLTSLRQCPLNFAGASTKSFGSGKWQKFAEAGRWDV